MPAGSTAYGIRTRVTAVKGRRPKPLDERGSLWENVMYNLPFDKMGLHKKEATGGLEPPYEVLQTSA